MISFFWPTFLALLSHLRLFQTLSSNLPEIGAAPLHSLVLGMVKWHLSSLPNNVFTKLMYQYAI